MRRFVMIFTALLMILSACRTPTQTGSGSTGSNEGLNLLITADGGVQLKRSGWVKFSQTTFGAMLHKGDLLLPAQGARVVVLCDGLTQWTVPAGAPVGLANGCPPSQAPVLRRGSSLIQSTRGGNDPLIPYIITPRKTKILDARPYLSWNPSPGASTYTVRLNTDRVIWEMTTDQTGLVYPGTPALQPGITYLLTVEADNGKTSSSEGAAGLGFSLLGAEEARSVNDASSQLASLKLSPEAESLALAQLYQGHNLVTEAIQALETLAAGQSQAAATYRKLGDLYLQSGLNLLAEQDYLKALDLSQTGGDLEGQAECEKGLGEVYAGFGQRDQAIQWLNRALENYKTLGDKAMTTQITQRLDQLK